MPRRSDEGAGGHHHSLVIKNRGLFARSASIDDDSIKFGTVHLLRRSLPISHRLLGQLPLLRALQDGVHAGGVALGVHPAVAVVARGGPLVVTLGAHLDLAVDRRANFNRRFADVMRA